MPEQKAAPLADIWGDTVNLLHLGGAMIVGIILGTLFYVVGLECIQKMRPDMVLSLQKAMGLVVGIVGCLLAAVVSTKLFPPKRTLTEERFSPENRLHVLKELGVDMAAESLDMKSMPPEIVSEMKDLQIYDIFVSPNTPETDEKNSSTKR